MVNATQLSPKPDPTAWSAFLKSVKIIPLGMITINGLGAWKDLAEVKPMLRDPEKRNRRAVTAKQSAQSKQNPLMETRFSIGGVEIRDSGHQPLKGAMLVSELRSLLGQFEFAKFIETDEGNGNFKRKLELHRKDYGSDQPGSQDIDMVRRSLASMPDETLVGFFLWVNKDGHGWVRMNLMLASWNQKELTQLPLITLNPEVIENVLTIDLRKHGLPF